MTSVSRVRTAGLIGMAGGLIWIVGVIVQYSLGLFTPDGSALRVVHQLIAFAGIVGAMIGSLGLIWGQAFGGSLGPLGVIIHILGWALIVVGGLALLLIGPAESPLFLLFPIGGNLQTLGYLLFAVAALVFLLTIDLPMLLGATPDGPGMLPELLQGLVWIGIGFAVFTASTRTAAVPATGLPNA